MNDDACHVAEPGRHPPAPATWQSLAGTPPAPATSRSLAGIPPAPVTWRSSAGTRRHAPAQTRRGDRTAGRRGAWLRLDPISDDPISDDPISDDAGRADAGRADAGRADAAFCRTFLIRRHHPKTTA